MIRPATVEDIPTCAGIVMEWITKEPLPSYVGVPNKPDVLASLREYQENGVVLWCEDGVIAGVMSESSVDASRKWIVEVCFYGGTFELIEKLAVWGKSQGAHDYIVTAQGRRAKALGRLYMRNGFIKCEEFYTKVL